MPFELKNIILTLTSVLSCHATKKVNRFYRLKPEGKDCKKQIFCFQIQLKLFFFLFDLFLIYLAN